MTTTGHASGVSDAVMRKLRLMVAKLAGLRGSERLADQNEAEAFAAAIKDMLDRHNLSMSDVEFAEAQESDKLGESYFDPEWVGVKRGKRRSPWQEELAVVVGHAHFCRILVVPGANAVFFLGRESHRQVCVYVYGMLLSFADTQSWKEYGEEYGRCLETYGTSKPSRGFRSAWLRGFNLRIAERYRAMERATVQQAVEQNDALAQLPGGTGTTGSALALRLDNLREDVKRFTDAACEDDASELKHKEVKHHQGLRKGYEAGGRVDLGRQALEEVKDAGVLPAS